MASALSRLVAFCQNGVLLLSISLVVSGCGLMVAEPASTEALVNTSAPVPLPMSEATKRLQEYLQSEEITATIQVQEEGAFMCGAYPRPLVVWSIRVTEPALTVADAQLDDIALAACCLRPGWVRLRVTEPSGISTVVTYAQADLEELSLKRDRGEYCESLDF
jgi:hypothetical protein